ncbi:hypothetical protein [Maricaulis sp.]|uniref:hypothetical protein n=1 Tax=Maricaulis sp. TaxID=1486257 RepID=UPI003A940B73
MKYAGRVILVLLGAWLIAAYAIPERYKSESPARWLVVTHPVSLAYGISTGCAGDIRFEIASDFGYRGRGAAERRARAGRCLFVTRFLPATNRAQRISNGIERGWLFFAEGEYARARDQFLQLARLDPLDNSFAFNAQDEAWVAAMQAAERLGGAEAALPIAEEALARYESAAFHDASFRDGGWWLAQFANFTDQTEFSINAMRFMVAHIMISAGEPDRASEVLERARHPGWPQPDPTGWSEMQVDWLDYRLAKQRGDASAANAALDGVVSWYRDGQSAMSHAVWGRSMWWRELWSELDDVGRCDDIAELIQLSRAQGEAWPADPSASAMHRYLGARDGCVYASLLGQTSLADEICAARDEAWSTLLQDESFEFRWALPDELSPRPEPLACFAAGAGVQVGDEL